MTLRPVSEHLAGILADARPLPPTTTALADAEGLVLAEDVAAEWSLPSFDNSSMDGYAVIAADVAGAHPDAPIVLPVTGDLAAGVMATERLQPGTAMRIMTGAPVPEGADAVVPVEWTDAGTQSVSIHRTPDMGAHVRRIGEDIAAGATVAESGTVITSRVIAILASVGRNAVLAHRRPRVCVISTGDELVEPGVRPGPGQLVDSNSYMLAAAVREAGAHAHRVGPVPDDEVVLAGILVDEAARCDLILTSGGVSMGAYDTVKAVLTSMGGVNFVKVAMQPGMPQGSGAVAGTPIVTLPGNPVSSYVSFEVFVRPLIRLMLGFDATERRRVHAVCSRAFTSPAHKTQFARVKLFARDGLLVAEPEGPQGSHIIGGLSRADGLAIIPPERTEVAEGDELVVMDLRSEA